MPFPTKQTFKPCSCYPAVERVGKFSESGEYSEVFRDTSDVKMPDCDSTDLEKLINANVDLKQMNTKIVNVRSVNLPEKEHTNEPNNKQTNEVNENENK